MDVKVRISRYFGRWLLNPAYHVVSVLTENGERVIIVHADQVDGKSVWLEVASQTDVSIVRIEAAKSLQDFSTPLADEAVLKLDPEAIPDD